MEECHQKRDNLSARRSGAGGRRGKHCHVLRWSQHGCERDAGRDEMTLLSGRFDLRLSPLAYKRCASPSARRDRLRPLPRSAQAKSPARALHRAGDAVLRMEAKTLDRPAQAVWFSRTISAPLHVCRTFDRRGFERFHHPHQTGELTPKCRPRDFLSGARRNLARNCLCHLEPNPRTRKQCGIRPQIQLIHERRKIVRTCLCRSNSLISGKIQGISANAGERCPLEASIHKGLAVNSLQAEQGIHRREQRIFSAITANRPRLSMSLES